MKYDLIVVTNTTFPFGNAPTNRLLSYLTGIAKRKKILFVTYAMPDYGESPNEKSCGTYEGIDYKYVLCSRMRKRPFIAIRAFMLYIRYVLLALSLTFVKGKSLLMYARDPWIANFLGFICKCKGFRFYSDTTEMKGVDDTEAALLKMKKSREKCDGSIVISKGLYDFFDNIPAENKFLLPVLVDMKRFTPTKETENYFFCCSGANLERDGLLDCLNGFLLFNAKYPGYKFEIASTLNLSDPYHIKCKDIMDTHPEIIKYLGCLPSNEIPQKLVKATALMLTPHQNYVTKGFPTKLGEYLASGSPVICSSIDDLMEVITDEEAYIVEPNHPEQIADKLEWIVNNSADAALKGGQGRHFMAKHYTIDSYIDLLSSFLKI